MEGANRSLEIAERYAVFEEAVGKNDLDCLLSEFYSEDVVFLGTGIPLSQGTSVKEILGGLCGAAMSVRVEQLATLEVDPGKVLIDFAIVHVDTTDGTSSRDRSTCVFHKRENGWRCVTDVVVREG